MVGTLEKAWEAGCDFHTHRDLEPMVSIPLVAQMADWAVTVETLVNSETGEVGGTMTVLGNGFHVIHLTYVDRDMPVAEVYGYRGGPPEVDAKGRVYSPLTEEPVAYSENTAEIVGWLFKYAHETGRTFPEPSADGNVVPIR